MLLPFNECSGKETLPSFWVCSLDTVRSAIFLQVQQNIILLTHYSTLNSYHLYHIKTNPLLDCIGGSVVEYAPATRETRVPCQCISIWPEIDTIDVWDKNVTKFQLVSFYDFWSKAHISLHIYLQEYGKYWALPGGELNPGLPRDRRGYSPLYYRGVVV